MVGLLYLVILRCFSFLSTLDTLLPAGSRTFEDYVSSRLKQAIDVRKNEDKAKSFRRGLFLFEWLAATQMLLQTGKQDREDSFFNSSSKFSEATLNKLCAALDNSSLSFVSHFRLYSECVYQTATILPFVFLGKHFWI